MLIETRKGKRQDCSTIKDFFRQPEL